MPRIERLDEPLNGSTFAASVGPLDHDEEAWAYVATVGLPSEVQPELLETPLTRNQPFLVLVLLERCAKVYLAKACHGFRLSRNR
jgi:hypothetical protein